MCKLQKLEVHARPVSLSLSCSGVPVALLHCGGDTSVDGGGGGGYHGNDEDKRLELHRIRKEDSWLLTSNDDKMKSRSIRDQGYAP